MASRNPSTRLIQAFFAWKSVLFIVAAFSPGPGYDTSALIASNPTSSRHVDFHSWPVIDRVSLNFFRWDALYFVKSAQRGYHYEQEWAFSWAYSLLLKTLVKLVSGDESISLQNYVWAGIIVSNACHLVSVVVLHRLSSLVLDRRHSGRVPFVAAMLHIVSPAGMFLSSPYAESLFAALNFTGMLLYAQARITDRPGRKQTVREDALILGAGVLFMLATWIRSNGLLSGILFLFDVVPFVSRLLDRELSLNDIRKLVITCSSGALLGLGSIGPQYVAYQQYCVSQAGPSLRPWCSKTIPSIYTWVQRYYWNVGFLRYWTFSNLPLFLMAGPMLWLLLQTGIDYLRNSSQQPLGPSKTQPRGEGKDINEASTGLPQLALPQLILAITAATNFHVQVINRLSSGYPVWYIATSGWMIARESVAQKTKVFEGSKWICRGLIIYALVQGSLFANFLPPA
ncbi:GPI mannosyltransferase 2 [Paraphaeosphaeria sporulosa]|uniref:GPI mannosyltransferase 2 n=1 Tax=Paraphaeosphaeria sporulosa TaxID=1460663 RepID=A0A177CXG2_9PLEO|nr:GPI mannosyltransferase 2 [Paraphaeosphaeria sporulosa]OAG12245.1 GPI mannosyltransferase 2 [Paraphaeosphaeria sporulosa]